MLQRKPLCWTQAGNNGGQPRGNRTICMQLFAVSRTTKANQRSLNGGWQASTNAFALYLCEPSTLQHCPPKKPIFLDWFNIPPLLFSLSPSHELNQESLFRLKVRQGCTLEIQGMIGPAWSKGGWGGRHPFYCLCFGSMVLKSTKHWCVDSFTLLCHGATSNLRGVDTNYVWGCRELSQLK